MRLYQMFPSIDGEVNNFHQGALTTFIRLAGCNLACSFCDTDYAQYYDSGLEVNIDEVIKRIEYFGIRKVTITGGEPLLQQDEVNKLCAKLHGYRITIETNGSIPIDRAPGAFYIVDYKLPSSGMFEKMKTRIFLDLKRNDFIKFVIKDFEDFKLARDIVKFLRGGYKKCEAGIAFSPVMPDCNPENLVIWMKKWPVDKVVLSVQIHKLLSLSEPTDDLGG